MSQPRKPELDERFADWVDGRLKPSERAALEAEMARDPELQRAGEAYRRHVQLLRSALAPEQMAESVVAAVMAQIAAPAAPPPRAWRPYLASAVAAAALVLVFIVVRAIPPAADPARSDVSRGTDTEDLDAVALKTAIGRTEDVAGVRRAETAPVPSELAAPQKEAGVAERLVDSPKSELPRADEPQAPGVDPGTTKKPGEALAKLTESQPVPPAVVPAPADAHDDISRTFARDLVALGEVALVAEVAVPGNAKLWTELDARASTAPANAAEILALLGAATEAENKDAGGLDFRRVEVVRAQYGAPSPPSATAGREGEKADDTAVAKSREQASGAYLGYRDAKVKGDTGPDMSRGRPALQPRPGDRVYRVSGSLTELRAFAAALHARVGAERGYVAFERLMLPAPARETGLRAELTDSLANDRSRVKQPSENKGRGISPAGPAGPTTPGPAAGVPGSAGGGGRVAGPPKTVAERRAGADQAEILLVLRVSDRR